jgi:hypothetical protein
MFIFEFMAGGIFLAFFIGILILVSKIIDEFTKSEDPWK